MHVMVYLIVKTSVVLMLKMFAGIRRVIAVEEGNNRVFGII